MAILDVSISNFKQHQSKGLQLVPGMNIIAGPNYSGKSTILQAIMYALFGPSVVPGGLKAVKPYGSNKRPKIVVSMELNGTIYSILRSGSSAKLEKGGELVASGQSTVTKAVEELLGMPAKVFSLLRTSPQDEAQAILTLGSAKLGQIVEEITQITIIDTVIGRAKDEALSIGDVPEQAESVDKLSAEEVRLRKELVSQYAEIESLKSESENLKSEHTKASEKANSLERRAREMRDLTYLRKELLERLKVYREQEYGFEEIAQEWAYALDAVPEKEKEYAEAYELEAKRVGLLNKKKDLTSQRDKLSSEHEIVRNDLSEWLSAGEFENRITSTQDSLRKFSSELEEIDKEIASLRQRLETVSGTLLNSVCQTCKRPFEVDYDLDVLTKEKAEIEERLSSLSDRREAARAYKLQDEAALRGLEDRQKKLEELRWKEASKEEKLKEVAASLLEVETSLERIPDNCLERAEAAGVEFRKAVEEKATAESAIKERDEAKRRAEETEKRLSEIPEEVESVDESEVATARDVERALYTQLGEVLSRLSGLESSYSEKYYRHQNLFNELTRIVNQNQERAEKRKRLALLKKLIKYLRDNRDRFVEDTWTTLLSYASEFASLSTNGDIVAVTRSSDGEFMFDEGEGPNPIVGASGVQKAIIGVGVRLALAEALNSGSDFMLLDEVTAGATEEVSLSMTRALAASGLQIVSVTHRQADAAAADNVVYTGG